MIATAANQKDLPECSEMVTAAAGGTGSRLPGRMRAGGVAEKAKRARMASHIVAARFNLGNQKQMWHSSRQCRGLLEHKAG
jgi:hypothetical protein